MQCKRCGADIHSGLDICPHCGARQKRQPAIIGCAHCGRRSSSELTVCPQCGRSLRSRRLPLGAVALGAVALLASLALYAASSTDLWTTMRSAGEDRIAALEKDISDLGGKVLDTASELAESSEAVTPTATRVVVLEELPEAVALVAAVPSTATIAVNLLVAPTTVPEAVALARAEGSVTSTQVISPAEVAAAAPPPTDTPVPPPTATPVPPTVTPVPTATRVPPTATRVPPTATRVPATATRAPATPTPAPPTATLELPTSTPVPSTPTAQLEAVAATGTGGGAVYTVQPGDDWFKIAQRFGLDQEMLAAYNDRTPASILQVDDKLRIPEASWTAPPAAPTPTATRPPTPTPLPTATAVPTAIPTLPAPTGLQPGNSDGFAAGAFPVLRWSPVPGMTDADQYLVQVRFATINGDEGYWSETTPQSQVEVPVWVFDLAAPPDRISRWTVQVRRQLPDGRVVELSPVSATGTFYWR